MSKLRFQLKLKSGDIILIRQMLSPLATIYMWNKPESLDDAVLLELYQQLLRVPAEQKQVTIRYSEAIGLYEHMRSYRMTSGPLNQVRNDIINRIDKTL
ncbi:hypothetical protein V6R21_06395 [Limibacter armeniacum]|uniref:hypothetical protein n=1 Tax=Limibacter armeniacum TaxID=466084 RepID=UPI002FE536A6